MILALKTDGPTTEAWLYAAPSVPSSGASTPEAAKPIAHLKWESGRQLSDELLGRLTAWLEEHQASLADLSGIIIFSGPGSFTSLRIGHATVNALADSLAIPVVGVDAEQWLKQGMERLGKAKSGQPALPHYGSPAHITRPKP